MVQLNSLRVLRETEEVLTVTSKFFNVAVWNFHVVDSVVRDYILIKLSALQTASTRFASAGLPCM